MENVCGSSNCQRGSGYNRRYCCVVGCHNREGDTDKKTGLRLKFHRFPGRGMEAERRQRWVTAIRRSRHDGGLWSPNSNTRICAAHFVGGVKADEEPSPSYVPSIFPKVYERSTRNPDAMTARYARAAERSNRMLLHGEKSPEVRPDRPRYPLQMSLKNVTVDIHPKEDWSGLSDLAVPASPHPQRCQQDFTTSDSIDHTEVAVGHSTVDSCTQTEADEDAGCQFSVLFAFVGHGCAETQLSHASTATKDTQCMPLVESAVGDKERECVLSGYNSIKDDPEALEDLTSVSANVFALLLSLLSVLRARSCDITAPNALLLFLMKMKLGVSFTSLGALFSVHKSTASRVFHRVLNVLTASTRDWIYTPPPDVRQAMMPECFKLHYPKCKYIIDCTEIKTETPPTVEQQRALFSRYKGTFTLKFLVGIVPSGQIAFVSAAYGGRTSDSEITVQSRFLDLIQHGDIVLSDKGFPTIRSAIEGRNAILVMPPFAYGNSQFSQQEVEGTYCIASVRIHVERAIQRIKVYNILNNRVPVTLIPDMSDVFHMCCVLANFQRPIIKK
ncbi:uncharacterized protein LOC135371441 [Ornithodoros turicata]|uniref:uncharacterized protein LOC135371441 n=1 Tax=Ornithodoros turicata TaxID=34597 RepID=UPI003138EF3D